LDSNGNIIDGNFSVHWVPGESYCYQGALKWPHLVASEIEGRWRPESGYSFTDRDSNGNVIPGQFDVSWQPGIAAYSYDGTTKWPHIVASDIEERWRPAPGYSFTGYDSSGNLIPGDMNVQWRPDNAYYSYDGTIKWPHVIAGSVEGQWYPEAGYEYIHADSDGSPIGADLTVRWAPGIRYLESGNVKWQNIITGQQEGQWLPSPGYVRTGKGADFTTRWEPRQRFLYFGSVTWPNIISTTNIGEWMPDRGYVWANVNTNGQPDDFSVTPLNNRNIRLDFGVYQKNYYEAVPETELAKLSRALRDQDDALSMHWAQYLKQIQNEDDYPNWQSKPYDIFAAPKR
jgi:hypothetical protein